MKLSSLLLVLLVLACASSIQIPRGEQHGHDDDDDHAQTTANPTNRETRDGQEGNGRNDDDNGRHNADGQPIRIAFVCWEQLPFGLARFTLKYHNQNSRAVLRQAGSALNRISNSRTGEVYRALQGFLPSSFLPSEVQFSVIARDTLDLQWTLDTPAGSQTIRISTQGRKCGAQGGNGDVSSNTPPSTTTQAPAATTQAPVATTQAPAATTHAPAAITQIGRAHV